VGYGPVITKLDDRELLRALARLDYSVRRDVTRKILRRAATPIRNSAKAKAPVESGDLKRSIRVTTTSKRGSTTGKVESKLPYAHLVELGTDPHWQDRKLKHEKKKRRWRHPGARPKPFLRPAFDEHRQEAINIARHELRTAILKTSKG
jgi:HK97 gp10 family phage protein